MPRDRISRFGGKMLPLRRKSARGASKTHSDLGKRCKALDAAQDFFFELYLRGNHVEGGRKSYAGVIGLILAWKDKQEKSLMKR